MGGSYTNLPRNDAQLRRLLLPQIKIAVDYVMEQIRVKNQEEINKVVYGAGNPSIYERSGQFLYSWETEKAKMSGMHVDGKFYYEPDNMEYEVIDDGEGHIYGRHGSSDDAWGDAREYLAEILYEGDGGHMYGTGWWNKKRDAWTALIKDIDTGDLDQWLREGFAKAGLSVR